MALSMSMFVTKEDFIRAKAELAFAKADLPAHLWEGFYKGYLASIKDAGNYAGKDSNPNNFSDPFRAKG